MFGWFLGTLETIGDICGKELQPHQSDELSGSISDGGGGTRKEQCTEIFSMGAESTAKPPVPPGAGLPNLRCVFGMVLRNI